MGGGLLQLVAYGAQDAYLSGNPQITFWKGLYKRHTNFAMESFPVTFSGQAAWNTKQSAILGRHADLLYSTYLEVVLEDGLYNNDQNALGFNLIKYTELEIGGQLIDRLYGEFLYLWSVLTLPIDKLCDLHSMIGAPSGIPTAGPGAVTLGGQTVCNNGSGKPSLPDNILYIPLSFFYCRSPAAALPLIALQYHEVRVNVHWNAQQFIAGDFTAPGLLRLPAQPRQVTLYVDYIYLDVEERRRMAQESHEYLIEQTQFNEDKGFTSYSNRIDLTFNHPVKELIWVVQPEAYTNCAETRVAGSPATRLTPFTYDNKAVYQQNLQINGQERMSMRYGDYFSKVQRFQHHSGGSGLALSSVGGLPTVLVGGNFQHNIYSYSFAIRPEEHQPSGTCNFSRIDTATLVLEMDGARAVSNTAPWNVRMYAINYNILRVMSGMAGLAYSN